MDFIKAFATIHPLTFIVTNTLLKTKTRKSVKQFLQLPMTIIYRLINSIIQLGMDYFYVRAVKYLPQRAVKPKFLTNTNCFLIDKYLKKDGTYKRSLPLFSIIAALKPGISESNLKCNAYALKILRYSNLVNSKTDTLISFLIKESHDKLDSKQFNGNEIFNIIQVISAFIENKKMERADEVYRKLESSNIEWKALPYFIRAGYLLVSEQLICQQGRAMHSTSEFESIANCLYKDISIDKISLNNSFSSEQGFSSHEMGYFLYFSLQLNYVKKRLLIYNQVMEVIEKLHVFFIKDKTIFDRRAGKQKKLLVNNSGLALIASVFFQSSIISKDYRYGNAGLFLIDYLIDNQNRYLGLLPNTLPIWSSKSPFQFPLWTQYYLLLAMINKADFLESFT